jgi:hypothetical protein
VAQKLGLLGRLLGTAAADFVPPVAVVALPDVVRDVVHDGVSWAAVADVALALSVWGGFAFVRAVCAVLSLVLRARGTGIAVSMDALAVTQVRTFAATRDGWAKVRARLEAADRASRRIGGGDQLHFRWRPFRGRRSVRAALSFDEGARYLRIEVHADDTLRAAAGLGKGGAFIALCQLVRLTGQSDAQSARKAAVSRAG